jgi:hypothetical protein
MTHKAFIYPAWFKSKRDLIEAIRKSKPEEIQIIVESWFDRHVFEVGASWSFDRIIAEQSNIDIEKEGKYRAVRIIVDRLLESGLYSETFNYDQSYITTKKYSILVFGSPQFISKDFK